MDLRQRRDRRSADAADRRRRRALRRDAVAQDVRAARGHGRAPVDVRLGHQGAGPEPRPDVLDRRQQRQDAIYAAVARYVYALDAAHGQADPHLRRRRPDRSPWRSRTGSRATVRRSHLAGSRPQGPVDPRRPCLGRTAGVAGRHPRLQRANREAAVELPHDSASGRGRLRDLVEGFVAGERWREQLAGHGARRGRAGSSTCRRDRRPPTSTAPTASATTSTPTRCIALNADTGKLIWHFQFVRHDIWDRDAPSPPSLITIRQNGKTIDAVAQATKHGYVFVFDRATGTPIFPIE